MGQGLISTQKKEDEPYLGTAEREKETSSEQSEQDQKVTLNYSFDRRKMLSPQKKNSDNKNWSY